MSKIQYPEDWLGAESLAVIINYSELTKFCKANNLNSGHLSYLVRNIQDSVLSTVNRMVDEDVLAAASPSKEANLDKETK